MELPSKNHWIAMITNRLTELVIVFIGVYAAFMLNAHQNNMQGRLERERVIAYLEKRTTSSLQGLKTTAARYDKEVDGFLTELTAGKMPRVTPIIWSTDYNANDATWLLQAGGLTLLDINTLGCMKDVDSAAASGSGTMAHYQQLSDQLIAPHLGEGTEFFYDPTTKQLRTEYSGYPDILKEGSLVLHNLMDKTDQLEKQLEVERKQNK